MKVTILINKKEQSKSYVDVHYNKWMRRYEEKKEREKKIRERKEAEEKAKANPSQNSTATVKEITPEEFERRQKEEAMKKKNEEENKNKPVEAKKEGDKRKMMEINFKKDMLCQIKKKDLILKSITGLKWI